MGSYKLLCIGNHTQLHICVVLKTFRSWQIKGKKEKSILQKEHEVNFCHHIYKTVPINQIQPTSYRNAIMVMPLSLREKIFKY